MINILVTSSVMIWAVGNERLGHVLLREDAEFHSFQMLESAFSQAEELDEERARITLVAATRYLAAHAPTARALRQTANLALRLHRGEDLSSEDPDADVEQGQVSGGTDCPRSQTGTLKEM